MPEIYRSYCAQAYRQTDAPDAPWLILFVASAEDLLTWAGIPQRTDSNAAGFQRADDPKRVQQTKEFFNLRPNQSPTALIVGLHRPLSGQRAVEVVFDKQPPLDALGPFDCRLVVHRDPRLAGLSEVIATLKAQFSSRLQSATRAEEIEATDDADEPEIDDDEESVDEKSFDVPHSVLHRLVEQLGDPTWVTANTDSLLELAKPATIIDGQHRAKGAAACERAIPFAVCAMLDCSWAEQVFQFTVVNYSAKGIPDQFITANAALSLTEGELDELSARLDQAKVKVVEYDLMKIVQYDEESPFFDLVNLTEVKGDPTKIGYKTMVRVANDWYSPTSSPEVFKQHILPALFPTEKSHRARVSRWHDAWGDFLIDFWRTVRDHYQSHTTEPDDEGNTYSLWTVGHSNLMIAIVIYEFQKSFFQHLNNQEEDYWEVPKNDDSVTFLRGKLRQSAQKYCAFYPPDFFATEWGTKALNISSGRKTLQFALGKLLSSKGKYQYGKSALVTGETD